MKQLLLTLWCMVLLPAPVLAQNTVVAKPDALGAGESQRVAAVMEALQTAYPEAGLRFAEEDGDFFALLGDDRLLVQSGEDCPKVSPNADREPPLCATFAFTYPVGEGGRHPEAGFDPGRIRNQDLLKKLYGSTRAEVEKNCVTVDFLGVKVRFNQRQGAAAALARVSERLKQTLHDNPDVRAYIFPTAGTFHWRLIKGSQRLSVHSFAIGIDLNVHKGLYWLWTPRSTAGQVEQIRQKYPQALVDAFEAEGFIWGGKWAAFDFMHFEYRPELLTHARRAFR